jgi:predicted CXXCH cytochrome family protein
MKRNNRFFDKLGMYRPLYPLVFLALVLFFSVDEAGAAMSIVQTKHNLSVSGPGTIRAVSEAQVCIFCHAPHNAESVGILWNRQDPTVIYDTYQSTTVQTSIGQPTGTSRMCLSCHDGTIALGAVSSRASDIAMTQQFLDSGPAALTTDLRDDHPISFVYDTSLSSTNPEYVDPTTLIDEVTLDKNNEMQCSSCHDAHDNTNGQFLKVYNSFSALCLFCHQPTGWNATSHKLSTEIWNGSLPDPWPHTPWTTIASNGCENCHRPHSAGGTQRLMNELAEEDNCLPCHNGNVAFYDIQSELLKSSVHDVSLTLGLHDPTENPLTVSRHVECVDCHNAHQVNNATAVAPDVSGSLIGVKGISASGVTVQVATAEYEVCFKCHADSATGSAPVTRQITEINKRLQFDSINPSYHPVELPGQNPNVPSLLPSYNTSSVIYCGDCHNNDNGPGASGTGPAGPHGSQWEYLLERQYDIADNTTETSLTYALCYKCHDRTSILGDQSFPLHRLHIVDNLSPCSVCHDPHGVSSTQGGNSINNSNLINFDRTVVFPNATTPTPTFEDQGLFTGRCSLNCHSYEHDPLAATPTGIY